MEYPMNVHIASKPSLKYAFTVISQIPCFGMDEIAKFLRLINSQMMNLPNYG